MVKCRSQRSQSGAAETKWLKLEAIGVRWDVVKSGSWKIRSLCKGTLMNFVVECFSQTRILQRNQWTAARHQAEDRNARPDHPDGARDVTDD